MGLGLNNRENPILKMKKRVSLLVRNVSILGDTLDE